MWSPEFDQTKTTKLTEILNLGLEVVVLKFFSAMYHKTQEKFLQVLEMSVLEFKLFTGQYKKVIQGLQLTVH